MMDRRAFLAALAAGSATAIAPMPARAATVGRVVVIGGGMAGATAAKYLRMWSGNQIDVTLIEKDTRYTSNILSNLVVTGQVALSSLYYTWANLVKKYGIRLVTGTVTSIERLSNGTYRVTAVNGATTVVRECERVVLAPGIDMDPVPETATGAPASILHAWQAGPQTDLLRQQLAAMPAGGVFVMTIPGKPYRCPPGPYERACVVADYLKRNKPGSKVIVLDANSGITAEPHNFGNAFTGLYSGVLEYYPSHSAVSVDSANQVLTFANNGVTSTIRASVLNVIPAHRAGAVTRLAGLTDTGAARWARVDPRTYESAIPGIHVLGDACATGVPGNPLYPGLPKAGHVGNQEAKICADAIVRAFNFLAPEQIPTANSACYSPISNTLASWLTAIYRYDPSIAAMVVSDQVRGSTAAVEAAGPSTGNFGKMNTWFKALMLDTFA